MALFAVWILTRLTTIYQRAWKKWDRRKIRKKAAKGLAVILKAVIDTSYYPSLIAFWFSMFTMRQNLLGIRRSGGVVNACDSNVSETNQLQLAITFVSMSLRDAAESLLTTHSFGSAGYVDFRGWYDVSNTVIVRYVLTIISHTAFLMTCRILRASRYLFVLLKACIVFSGYGVLKWTISVCIYF